MLNTKGFTIGVRRGRGCGVGKQYDVKTCIALENKMSKTSLVRKWISTVDAYYFSGFAAYRIVIVSKTRTENRKPNLGTSGPVRRIPLRRGGEGFSNI